MMHNNSLNKYAVIKKNILCMIQFLKLIYIDIKPLKRNVGYVQ